MQFAVADVFPYPLVPCPPIAVFSTHFAAKPPVIRISDPRKLGESPAVTVAAPMTVISSIDPKRWTPVYPVIVFSDPATGPMSQQDRDYIWRTFGVPVFEYLFNDYGQIIARECEAHQGMHIDALNIGLQHAITNEPCPCGRSGSRVLDSNAIIGKAVGSHTPLQEWRNWQTHQT